MSDSEEEPTAVMVTIRLMPLPGRSAGQPEEHKLKVLLRTTISHVLRTASASFPGYFSEDFVAYLIRPNQEIVMDTGKQLHVYGIRCYDVIELRRKQIPITLHLDIHEEETREVTVNSSLPVYAIVKQFCRSLKINHSKELSLAFPPREKARANISRMEWLDATQSLNAQGIANGATLLLRKKFFIFNEDVREAEHNPLLRELLYCQLQQQLQHSHPPVRTKRLSSQGPLIASPHHSSVSTSSEAQTPNVTEQDHSPLPTSTVLAEVMEVLNSDSKATPEKQFDFVNTLSRHHISQFEVKITDVEETLYVCIQSKSVCLSDKPKFSSKSEFVRSWPLRLVSTCEIFHGGVKLVMDDGESEVLFSKEADELASYINQAITIMKEKGDNSSSKSSAKSSPENKKKLPLSLSPTPEQEVNAKRSSSPSPPPEQEVNAKRSSSPSPPPEYASVLATSTDKKKPISISFSVTSFESSNSSERSASAPFDDDTRADTSEVFSSLDPSIVSPLSSHDACLPTKKKEKLTDVHPPSYFGLDYRDIRSNYALVHFIILDQDIRPLLVNIHSPVRNVIEDVCQTFCIPYPGEHFLKFPKSVEDLFKRYGGKPHVIFGKTFKPIEQDHDFQAELLLDSSLKDQFHFEIKPCVLSLKRRNFEDVDAAEHFNLETGTEWPDSEDPGVARYRRFFQYWNGVVQGNFPVDKKLAIRLAGLLILIYHGDHSSQFWSPSNIDYKALLPKEFHGTVTETDVLKAHRECNGMKLTDAIDLVLKLCEEAPGMNGLAFDIKVPMQTEVLNMITWNKMEPRKLCVSRKGFVCLKKNSKKVCLEKDFSMLNNWASSQSSFRLVFQGEVEQGETEDCHGVTYQSHQLLEMMEVYVRSTYHDRMNMSEKKGTREPSVTDV